MLGQQMLAIVVAWDLYRITRSPIALGNVGLAQVLPQCAGYPEQRQRQIEAHDGTKNVEAIDAVYLQAKQLPQALLRRQAVRKRDRHQADGGADQEKLTQIHSFTPCVYCALY